ncbi:MAG: integrating conjugative element protein [Gammaproteobacteria bacterium]|nr:integrating conjugative element protein [Gammaproteobacteria bacterium]
MIALKQQFFGSRILLSVLLLSSIHDVSATTTSLVPLENSGFYYEIGGGNDIPLPAFYDTGYIPLRVNSQVGLGMNCLSFNPIAAMTDSLNQIKSSFLAVQQQVLASATAAVTTFPMYELSRADPNLYNLITTAMAGAHEDIGIATKSCQMMQSQIAAGQNPYAHWAQLSLGNHWQKEIGTASLSGQGDINQASYDVGQTGGKNGVLWIKPNYASHQLRDATLYYAGGENQPPIHVMTDVVTAGYDVIINDHEESLHSSQSSTLVATFPTPEDAAKWVTHIIGEDTITTYDGGDKNSQPGVGLNSAIQTEEQTIEPKLAALVNHTTPLTVENLQAISPPGLVLTPAMIESLQQQPAVTQQILTSKLSQNIAALRIMDKARLAIQLLQTGEAIPEVYSNTSAKQRITEAIQQLQQQVKDILLFIQAREQLMSRTLMTIVQAGDAAQRKQSAISTPMTTLPLLSQGAVKNTTTPKEEK